MTLAEAHHLLDLPETASTEEAKARFQELRHALEEKIANAATPGLAARYRATLVEITTAYETITLAADATSIPALGKVASAALSPSLRANSAGPAAAHSVRRRPTRLLVLFAVTLFLAGASGWWHWQEQRSEALRLAVARQAETERLDRLAREQAEQERLAAERKRQEEQAELARQEKLGAELTDLLKKLKQEWSRREAEVTSAESSLAELRQLSAVLSPELPEAQEAKYLVEAQTRYMAWLERYLSRHPAVQAGLRAEESLKARQLDAAKVALEEMAQAVAQADREIKREQDRRLEWHGTLDLQSSPEGLNWSLTDNFGYTQSGVTPAKVKVAPGKAQVVFQRPAYQDVVLEPHVTTGKTTPARAVVETQEVKIQAEDDVQILINGELRGIGTAHLWDAPPGEYKIELRRASQPVYRTSITVRQIPEPAHHRYSFTALAREDRKCDACNGQGRHERTERCSTCSGRGGYTCTNCRGRGFFTTPNGELRMNCRICGGDGRETCRQCNRGRVRSSEPCRSCGGDGRVSQLQLSQRAK